jgi:hypothetical protein
VSARKGVGKRDSDVGSARIDRAAIASPASTQHPRRDRGRNRGGDQADRQPEDEPADDKRDNGPAGEKPTAIRGRRIPALTTGECECVSGGTKAATAGHPQNKITSQIDCRARKESGGQEREQAGIHQMKAVRREEAAASRSSKPASIR